MQKHVSRAAFPTVPHGIGTLALTAVICLNTANSAKPLAMAMLLLTLFAGLFFRRKFREQANWPLLFLFLITLIGGISVFYAVSGKFALREFLSLLTAFCTATLLTILPDGKTFRGRTAAYLLAGAVSLISLISLDLVSTRLLSTPILSVLNRISAGYADVSGLEEGVRITSLFGTPNVFAGCTGLGVLLSIMLATVEQHPKSRWIVQAMLLLNAVTFLLAFSMGAILSIVVSFPVFLLMEQKERRGKLLILMAETLLISFACLVPISMTALQRWNHFQPIPMISVAVGAALLCLINRQTERFLEKSVSANLIRWILPLFLTIAVLFSAVATILTGPAQLTAGEQLRRAVYLTAGDYTVTSQGGDGISVIVEDQNQQDVMMHTATILYEGPLDGASFSVPADTLMVWFQLDAESDTTLTSIICHGPKQFSVPLGYPLLPNFIANRLQGLRANQNAIQRLVFMGDGLKLFRQSPLYGLGLGAFESRLFSVQDFYYETKYVHNHYVQTLLETGLIGFALFLGLLVVSAVLVFRNRKQENSHPFTAGLGALLVFMAAHSMVEVVLSSGFYLPLAFSVFALLGLCCGKPLRKNAIWSSTAASAALFLAATGILLGCNLRAQQIGHHATTVDDLAEAASIDPFEWTDYALSYISYAPSIGTPEVMEQAEQYVLRLSKKQSNTIFYHLACYCFETGQNTRGMELLLQHMEQTISSSQWWNSTFALVYEYDDGSEMFRRGIQDLYVLLEQWDAAHMGQIQLEPAVQNYVDQALIP